VGLFVMNSTKEAAFYRFSLLLTTSLWDCQQYLVIPDTQSRWARALIRYLCKLTWLTQWIPAFAGMTVGKRPLNPIIPFFT
jgi:hypothetical protein